MQDIGEKERENVPLYAHLGKLKDDACKERYFCVLSTTRYPLYSESHDGLVDDVVESENVIGIGIKPDLEGLVKYVRKMLERYPAMELENAGLSSEEFESMKSDALQKVKSA